MSGASTANRLIVLASLWRDGSPLLRVRLAPPPGRDPDPSDLVPAVGFEINYRVEPNPVRHCLGRSTGPADRTSFDCDDPPQPGERLCIRCAVAEATVAGNLHHAHTRGRDLLDSATVDHLSKTNMLYLAGFRDGSVKVGTSTKGRRHTRLTEQGAWIAVEVAEVVDGFVVRELEDLVTTELGLTQAVAVKRKLQGMASPMDDAVLEARLKEQAASVHRLIDRSDVSGAVPIDRWWRFTDAPDGEPWSGLHLYPGRLDRGAHHIEILAMCGRMAILSRPGSTDRFVADLGSLYGIELDIGDHQPDELLVQDSLF